ncbi:MAG: S1 RNA-binding domain-containing protein [Firmicutes bacterium]|nr:S1 RNA-binding domain-containing protein [Bacillota bacterium]
MSVEVGQVLNGKVTGIQSFGAFVALEGEKTQGLIHISEVSNTYVKDINSFLQVGQEVQVKVIKVDTEKNKISLSIRALMPEPEEKPRRERSERGPRPDRKRGTLGARKRAPQQFKSEPDEEGYSTLGDALREAMNK